MANFGRIKTWTDETLTPADLNAEFNNVINNVTSGGIDSDNIDETDNYAWSGTHSFSGAVTHTSTVTVGVDDTGHDVKFFGATSGKSWLWDEITDTMIVTGDASVSGTLEVTGGITFTGAVAVDDTTDATSATTGSIQTDGGLGIVKALWVGTTSRLVGNVTMDGTFSAATGSTIGNLTFANGSITDSSNAISFGNEALSTTGTLSAGATTVTAFDVRNDQNGATQGFVTNDTAGAAARAQFWARSNSNSIQMSAYSSSFTTSNQYVADSGLIEAQGSSQLGISASTDVPIVFYQNGGEVARIAAGGSVGIGTATPAVNTHIWRGNAGTDPAWVASVDMLMLESDGSAAMQIFTPTNGAGYIEFSDPDARFRGGIEYVHTTDYMALYTAGAESMRLDASGNLTSTGNFGFVGEASPSAPLSGSIGGYVMQRNVVTDATTKYAAYTVGRYTNAEGSVSLIGGNSAETTNTVQIGGGNGNFKAATSVQIYTAANATTAEGTVRATIDASGNLGLGASPLGTHASYTSMNWGGNGYIVSDTAVGAGVQFSIAQNAHLDTDGTWDLISTDEASYYRQIDGKHQFFTCVSDTAGQPAAWGTAKLTIGNTGQSTFTADLTGDYIAQFKNLGNDASNYGIQVWAGANDASGNTVYFQALDGDGTEVGYIWNTSGTFQLVDPSDATLKTDIDATEIKGIENLRQINIVDYYREKDTKKESRIYGGFTAQDLLPLYPQAVAQPMNEDGTPGKLGVAKTELIGPIIKSVQELDGTMQTFMGRDLERSQEIDGLQAQIEALTEEIAALRKVA